MYEDRWYDCEVREIDEATEPPDLSRIPFERHERVMADWRERTLNARPPKHYKMWGPQLDWYHKQAWIRVAVLGPSAG